MLSLTRRLAIIAALGAVLFFIASLLRARGGDARFHAAKDRATAACRAYRAHPERRQANVCRDYDEFGPNAIVGMKRTEAMLAEAEASAGAHDPRAAEDALARAVRASAEIESLGSTISDLVVSNILGRVVDVLAAHPELDRGVVLREARLRAAAHPFESTRVQEMWSMSRWTWFTGGRFVGQTTLADILEQNATLYLGMERAIAQGDVATCAANARRMRQIAGPNDMVHGLCEKFARVVAVGARLEAMRATGPASSLR